LDDRPGRRPLSDWVASQLYELIFSGRLAPGDAIGEIEITRLLGVSRSPIRDALRQLEESGVIEVAASSGRRTVRRFSVDDIFELYTIRMSLESMAAGRAVDRISDGDLERLGAHLAEMEAASHGPRSPVHDYSADFRFHEAICRAGGMPRLVRLLEGVWLQSRALLHHLDAAGLYPTADELVGAIDDHSMILARLRDGDVAGCEEAVRRHLEIRRDHVIDAVRDHGGLASP
jgi:DNA-binding GntR family transcriptional regulator